MNHAANTTALSINLNKIALIRNSRDTDYPSVTDHARMCIDGGCDGITVHPRPDQRHIRVGDCFALAKMLSVEFNIEGNPFAGPMASNRDGVGDYPGFLPIVEAIRPAQCTLVPDSDDQLTSDHGFDLTRGGDKLLPVIERLHGWGVRVSLFMDPEPEAMVLADGRRLYYIIERSEDGSFRYLIHADGETNVASESCATCHERDRRSPFFYPGRAFACRDGTPPARASRPCRRAGQARADRALHLGHAA